jgi:hypothetical protein
MEYQYCTMVQESPFTTPEKQKEKGNSPSTYCNPGALLTRPIYTAVDLNDPIGRCTKP